ncbi:hypothetical protein GGX14DRAFT_580000 [Mycena pura]|uniref:Uncharacterized protein n=1 Tax=Mycena pura TaxID=153505 RepID=A0AAD6UQU9_9AGAR|nr:hypothetical protein GGX14DRAFT_580000 [Mycena pura]
MPRAGAGRLQTLRLGAIMLSPERVDLLAEKLPGLRRLELLVRDVVGFEGDLPLYFGGTEQDDSQIGSFLMEMEQRSSFLAYRMQYTNEGGPSAERAACRPRTCDPPARTHRQARAAALWSGVGSGPSEASTCCGANALALVFLLLFWEAIY